MTKDNSSDFFAASLDVDKSVVEFVFDAEKGLSKEFKFYDEISKANQAKVLSSFKSEKISSTNFNPTTGYGYSDMGREKLSALFARIFKGEKAIVSPHILSGTHAIFLTLSSLLSKDECLLSVCGKPYDTLATAIGISSDVKNTLIDRGVVYKELELNKDKELDINGLEVFLKTKSPKIVYIQRSRGYDFRPSVDISTIKKAVKATRELSPKSIIVCDNCYGEFCETKEPLEVGVDIIIGSLIKNPGGGLAPNGGYIIGKENYISRVEDNFTAPGLGLEVGSYNAGYIQFFQGIYMAPKVTAESIKGAILTSYVMDKLNYEVLPKYNIKRTDITQSIKFNKEDELIKFIQGIQKGSPVDSFALPLPWDMPGYENKVIMAAGTFIQGSSIELSADAPIKKPYIAFMQGGLTFEAHMFGLITAVDNMGIL
jgi:cystathionine beta-lyase family protein involved in aluminum resistance